MSSKATTALCLFLIPLLTGNLAKAEEAKKDLLPDKETCGHQKVSDMSTGKSAEIGEFPWLALLRYDDENGKSAGFRCVGSLISPRYVLTTAVCATPTEVTLAGVRLGEYNLTSEPDCIEQGDEKKCSDPAKDFGIEQKVAHTNFSRKTGNNDIALIRLDKEVTFSDSIQPICLPLSGTTTAKPGDTVAASGWGRSITGDLITIKKKVVSSVLSNEECSQEYAQAKREITENHLCTRASRNNTAFTCSGDSGGPLMFFSDNQWHQDGIVSFGRGCGYTLADGNTRVANYIEWIKENMLA